MDFDSVIMTREIHPHFSLEKLVVNPYAALASITSGCILAALECRRLLLDEILKIHIAGVTFTNIRAFVSAVVEARSAEIVKDQDTGHEVDKIDVKNVDYVKLVEHAGKEKKGNKKVGKKGGKGKSNKGNQNLEQEKAAQRKKEEEERLKKWNEDWEKKLKAQEALDEIPCCSAKGLCLKPKTQSNIWIKVTQEKKTQDIQMAFMHVPVPRPKAPPLPKLVKIEPEEVPPPMPKKKKDGKKKKGKGKKK